MYWKKLIKKIVVWWIHVIGIACCFGSSLFMSVAAFCFIFYGGIVLKTDLNISIIAFIMGVFAMFYCIYLLMKLFREINK